MTDAAATPGPSNPRPLDDLMLAMDVVDTLRHQQRLVERELDREANDEELIRRLRDIYAAQGIEVTDEVLAEGVAALREQRFAYSPPEAGFARTIAELYVSRVQWGRPLLIGVGVIAALWLGYHVAIERPRELAEERARIELSETIPTELDRLQSEVTSLAKVDEAKSLAAELVSEGQAAAREGNGARARAAVSRLNDLLETLRQTYELRVISRPGEPSGIWRVPDANPNASNYYLIVEAIDESGKTVPVTIVSEEDQTSRRVEKWGVRVDESVFNRFRADKQDDGIIQDSLVGLKHRGELDPEYRIRTAGGTITEW
jgi:hypothetical protein